MFYYTLNGKKISGWINIPKKSEPVPLIVQIRGFVPVETYTTGTGTQHSGEVYAKNGYITLAPDFLGYGESDKSSPDALEDRFLTYTTVLQLLASLQTLNSALQNDNYKVSANMQKIGLWGHSNGGHIALSILEITSGKYPTVLWAPVSKPFPYSVLYFTDEFDDHGQGLRKVIAGFEQNYNIQNYSFDNFYDWIDAPIQFNQGTADEEVPQRWTDQIVNELKTRKKDITYITYPGEDHNFSKGTWSKLVDNSLNFFKSEFAK
jgi:dipeptidyl aminopeptidase/acylaminoacyl peptidase